VTRYFGDDFGFRWDFGDSADFGDRISVTQDFGDRISRISVTVHSSAQTAAALPNRQRLRQYDGAGSRD
jgi:hypothetical protein